MASGGRDWLVLCCSLLVLASLVPTGGLAQSGAQADGPTNETPVPPHRDPAAVDEPGDLSAVQRWLATGMADRLEDNAVHLSQSEYQAARSVIGDGYNDALERYVDVAGETSDDGDDEAANTFERTQQNQSQFTDTVERFEEEQATYREAQENGNTDRARRAARNAIAAAEAANATATNLNRHYGSLGNLTGVDMGRANREVQSISAEVTEAAEEIRRQTFISTDLALTRFDSVASFLDPIHLEGTLRDEDGAVVPNATIALQTPTGAVETTTNATGQFTLTHRPRLFPTGEQALEVTFEPASNSRYGATEVNPRLRIDPVEAEAILGEVPTPVGFGDSLTTEATLRVEDTQIDGIPLQVRLDGQPLASARTGARGEATFTGTIPAGIRDGNRTIRVTGLHPARAIAVLPSEQPVQVLERDSSLSMTATQAGNRIRVQTSLEAMNRAVPSVPIRIRLENGTTRTIETNANGEAVTTFQPPAGSGTYTVEATFENEGTNLREATASEQVSVSLTNPSGDGSGFTRPVSSETLPWVLIGLGLIAVLAGAIGWRYRDRLPGRSRSAASTASPETTDTTGEQSSEGVSTPAASEPPAWEELLEAATIALAEHDDPIEAVEFAYQAVRHRHGDASTRAMTHWEYLRSAQEDLAQDTHVAALRSLTEAYEAAAYDPAGISAADAEDALRAARTLVAESS